MDIDWNDVHHFVTLVEKQTLTAAAEQLDVQHGTVSRRIHQLEAVLGLRLFDRVGKRYFLTRDGEIIYRQACELSRDMKILKHVARTQAQGLSEVTISAPPLLLREVLSHELPEFHREHASIRLLLTSDVRISNLHTRDADIALRIVYPEHDDLAVARLRSIHYGFYAHAGYLARHGRKDWQFLHFSAEGNRQSQWSAESIGDQPIVMATNDFGLIKQYIANQQGIGLLPDFAVRPSDGFQPVSLQDDVPGEVVEQLYLVMHENIRNTPRVRAVADFLTRVLSR